MVRYIKNKISIGLNSNQIKLIAIVAMFLNHTEYLFMGNLPNLNIIIYSLMKNTFVFPLMGYLLVEGFEKTKNIKSYILRMFLFACISQIPFSTFKFYNLYNSIVYNPLKPHFEFYKDGSIILYTLKLFSPFNHGAMFNVLFTFFFSLCLLYCISTFKNKILKILTIILLVLLSYSSDWGGITILGLLAIYKTPKDKRGTVGILLFYLIFNLDLALVDIAIINTPISFFYNFDFFELISSFIHQLFRGSNLFKLLMVIPIIKLYNNQSGRLNLKYLFYIFYPVHMIVLCIIKSF